MTSGPNAEPRSSAEAPSAEPKPSGRFPGASSLAIVVVIAVAWVGLCLAAPGVMEWLSPNPIGRFGREGPIEWVENLVLPLCIGLWLLIAVRHRADRVKMTLALLMVLQLVLIFGEELDWGQTIGLRAPGGWRNLRMTLRDIGVLHQWDDAIVPTAYLLLFMCVPLLPIAGVQRALARAAPVRAQVGDGLAIVVLPPTWMLVTGFVVELTSVELIEVCTYAVTLNVALRILRTPGDTALPASTRVVA